MQGFETRGTKKGCANCERYLEQRVELENAKIKIMLQEKEIEKLRNTEKLLENQKLIVD